jgi:hypothetical protein
MIWNGAELDDLIRNSETPDQGSRRIGAMGARIFVGRKFASQE